MSARHVAALLPLLAACKVGEVVELEVDHYQIPCLEERLHLCKLTRDIDAQLWDRFFEPIEGWDFPWGERSTLRLLKRKKVSTYGVETDVYQLDEVLGSEPVAPGTEFTYPFRPNEQDPRCR